MASEIRVDKINSLSGVGTVTLSPTGVDIAGITTAATLRATTGIVTSLTAGSLTSLGAVSGTTGTFSGDVDIADKIVHTGDTNTAIRFPAADTFTVETGGSERFRVDSTGNTLIYGAIRKDNVSSSLAISGGNAADSSANIVLNGSSGSPANVTQFRTGSTERVRITSTGTVGIATASPRAQFDVIKPTGNVIALFEGSNASQNHRVRIDASGGSSTTGLSISNSASNNQTSMYHSGGNNNMVIMGGQTAGAEPTAGTAVATFASGGDVTVNTGNLVIGTSGKGIDFSATGDGSGGSNVSELLDDYEEGTWTPTVNGTNSNLTHRVSRYTKIGNLVSLQVEFYTSGGNFSTGANMNLTNLPFSGPASPMHVVGSTSYMNSAYGMTLMTNYLNSSSQWYFNQTTGSGLYLWGNITYQTA